jgi:hypothetical protein
MYPTWIFRPVTVVKSSRARTGFLTENAYSMRSFPSTGTALRLYKSSHPVVYFFQGGLNCICIMAAVKPAFSHFNDFRVQIVPEILRFLASDLSWHEGRLSRALYIPYRFPLNSVRNIPPIAWTTIYQERHFVLSCRYA